MEGNHEWRDKRRKEIEDKWDTRSLEVTPVEEEPFGVLDGLRVAFRAYSRMGGDIYRARMGEHEALEKLMAVCEEETLRYLRERRYRPLTS